MRRILPILLVGICVLVTSLSSGQGIKLATDAPKAIPPEESVELFRVSEGFQVELVASEPHLADPTAIAFDARGRIFVAEIHGYNLEGYLDVLELNKTGVLDKAVRRILAPPEAIKHAKQEQYGTVKLLEDSDGDGLVDASHVWADRLPACYGVVAARGGVIAMCAPDIIYLADRDGDGKAEVRQTLFTGFGLYEMWSRISNPRWGVDNWIYCVNGIRSGGTITGPNLAKPVTIGAVCFRFKPDGSALEACSGSASGFGQAINDWGDRFLVTNQQHALSVGPIPYRYLARNPYYAAPKPVVNISTYGHPARVYPISRPDPWRTARSKDPAWVKFYGAAEATANGFFTAASGQTVYRADAFGAEFRGNHFSVDNAHNLVHRCLLLRDGTDYTVRRPREDETVEFLTSTEQWFRPVNLETGPDGALYIVDMYRGIIEDYSAIPRYLQQLYIESLIGGSKRGRIWRVVHEGAPKSRRLDLADAPSERLVDELSNPNCQWRLAAQRLLVQRADKTAAGRLADLVRQGKTPQARLHALYTLDGLDALEPGLVTQSLGDAHFAVRMHALCLAERWLDKEPALTGRVLQMVDDPEPRVRLQLAFTLGQSKDRRATEALAVLASRDGGNRWIRAAVMSSVPNSSGRLLHALLNQEGGLKEGRFLAKPIATVVGARRQDEEIGQLLGNLAEVRGSDAASLQTACLEGLVEGLERGKARAVKSPTAQQGLSRLLVSPSPRVQELAVRAAGLVKLQESEGMKKALAAAKEVALDDDRAVADRQAAIGLLRGATYAELASIAEELLESRQPLDIQLAAVAALASASEAEVGSLLLENWPSYTPKVQIAIIEAIFGRKNRLPNLLDAMQAGVVRPSALDALRRERLLKSPDANIRQRAEKLLAGRSADKGRQAVLARYVKALAGPRDAGRGKEVFDKQCAKCHQLEGEGYVVGPDLSVVSSKSDEMLVTDVLDPNNVITVGFNNYTVVTDDGRIFTGVLASETATSVALCREEGKEQTILRKDIDEMEASPLSMMPEDLEKEVSPQNIADLIAFLRKAYGTAPSMVALFEDDPKMVSHLSTGRGTVRLDSANPFSGKASLVVTPPQRFNPRIPGWQYRIAEKPEPGQYRYIRFAWKSRGEGVMIELAADGAWPPAEKPLRRYYSGRNSTDWQAVEVSPDVPGEWTVVTRDLWKDFGPFTLTGIAPTAMGGAAFFDRIELLRALDEAKAGKP